MSYRYSGQSNLFLPTSTGHNGRSKMVKFGILEVWAEEGVVNTVVNCPDSPENGRHMTLDPDVAEHRLKKVAESMGRRGDLGMAKDNQDLKRFQDAWEGVKEVIHRARVQAESMPKSIVAPAEPLQWSGKRKDGTGAVLS